MASVLNSIWSWVTGKPEVPELPKNILFERDVTADNDFWVISIALQNTYWHILPM